MNTEEPRGTTTVGEHQEAFQEPLTWPLPGLSCKDDLPHGPMAQGVWHLSIQGKGKGFSWRKAEREAFPEESLLDGDRGYCYRVMSLIMGCCGRAFWARLGLSGENRQQLTKEGVKAVWRGASMDKQGQGKRSQLIISRGTGHCVCMAMSPAWSLKYSLTILGRLHSVLMSVQEV